MQLRTIPRVEQLDGTKPQPVYFNFHIKRLGQRIPSNGYRSRF